MPSTKLAANALTSFEAVKCELALSDDKQPIIERLINAVSDQFESFAGGRSFYFQSGIVELHRGFGGFRLITKKAPIVGSITTIILRAINGDAVTTYDAASFQVEDADNGFVFRGGDAIGITQGIGSFGSGFPWTAQSGQGIRGGPVPGTERKAIEVTYDAGFVTEPQQENTRGTTDLVRNLPYDIEQAVIDSVVAQFRRRGRDKGVLSKSSAEVSVTFSNDVPGLNSGLLLPEGREVAESYMRAVIVG